MVLLWLLPLTPSENVLKWFGYKKDIQERGPIYPLCVNEEEYLTLFTAGSEPFTLIMTN